MFDGSLGVAVNGSRVLQDGLAAHAAAECCRVAICAGLTEYQSYGQVPTGWRVAALPAVVQ
jgi:hypothetical protein